VATASPGFAVNEAPLLLRALRGGEAEADKGTRLPDTASQRAWRGVELEVTSSLLCCVFMGPSFSKHNGNLEIM